MSLNSFLTNKFTKNIPYGTMVQALIVRYQTLFIIYINLAFLLLMAIWTFTDQFLFALPGKSLIMPILPLILASLASLKTGKVDMAAGLLLLYLHTANFICSHIGDLVLGSSQLLLLLPGIGYFISSSRTVHILNIIFCIFQNAGHIITINSVFQVTFTEEQSFQIFIFQAISFPMLLQSSLLFFAQKSIESKLWQMVQSNCERAEEITKELVEALEAKDVFVSSLSHEIRNPLNSLNGSIDYLLKVIKDNAHLQVLENAKLSGEVLLNLVSNLLDAAKLKSEKMELSYMETNPIDIIKKVLTINSSAFSHKRIFAQAFIEKNVPKKLTLDSSRILQIIMNLVSNAIKFTFEGGRIQIQMAWCSQDKTHEELLQPMDTKCLADALNCEDEMFSNQKNSIVLDGRDSIPKVQITSLPTISATSKDSVESLCASPNNEPACCDEFSTVESQSHICNLRHLKDNKKVKGLGQVYSFHSLLSENYDVLTASNMGPKSLYSLDDLVCVSEEKTETKGYLKVQITDTGCGIAEDNIPKLFNMFSQADANISRQYGGTGLGLWISKQLCQKMGGDIAVYSKLDHGTTFTFYIEVNNNMSMTDSASKSFPKRHRGKVRALVVDDYAYNRDLHKLILEREGVEVHLACDGNEAVAKYKANEDDYFDFIMMDIQMPGLDGLSAAQQIRAFEVEKNYKVVDIYFVSGNYYANEAGILVENIPRTQFLRKPVNLDIIKKIVGTYGALLRDTDSASKRKNNFLKGRSAARKLSPNIKNCANNIMAASTVSSGDNDRRKGSLESNMIKNNASEGTCVASKKAVLIVDDDNFNIFTIQLQLENQNLDILVAHNGQEALEIVARKHDEIEVVLMDCEMPIMSGYESTAKIRELEKNEKNWRPLRIYGLSGHTDSAHRTKCLTSGMNNVLTKPLDFQKVVDLIYNISP